MDLLNSGLAKSLKHTRGMAEKWLEGEPKHQQFKVRTLNFGVRNFDDRSRKATLQLPFSPRPPSSSSVRERLPSTDTARRFWDEVWKMSQKKVDYVW